MKLNLAPSKAAASGGACSIFRTAYSRWPDELIIYQGDTEFASVEQAAAACSSIRRASTDRKSLCRVVTEEMRHGWQMLPSVDQPISATAESGSSKKCLNAVRLNPSDCSAASQSEVANWLDFFTLHGFVDRDGKFQLTMLSYSGFEPAGSVHESDAARGSSIWHRPWTGLNAS